MYVCMHVIMLLCNYVYVNVCMCVSLLEFLACFRGQHIEYMYGMMNV